MQHKLIEIPESDLLDATEMSGHKNAWLIAINNFFIWVCSLPKKKQ